MPLTFFFFKNQRLADAQIKEDLFRNNIYKAKLT